MIRAGGVFPFLYARWIAEHNCRDVEALHLGENIFHILARGGRIKCRSALLLYPTERLFFVFRIGSCELRGVGTHRREPRKVTVHCVDVNINHRWSFGVRVLCEAGR